MSRSLPDFVIIGAMKCGTSSLHEQLAARSGVFMSRPKEPNFFSDDAQYARGLDWYSGLFADAVPGQIRGESSTHYTKRPTYPRTVERMQAVLADVKLVYVLRDPLERIVSQYIHEWTQREVGGSLERAVSAHERYAAYSAYAMQLEPYLRAWSSDSLLLVAYERLVAEPDLELERIFRFLGDPSPEPPVWREEAGARNVSAERLRRSGTRERLLRVPALRGLKEALPPSLRALAKRPWQIARRPTLAPATRRDLERRLDADLARLGHWLGRELTCASWGSEVRRAPLDWPRSVGGEALEQSASGGGRY